MIKISNEHRENLGVIRLIMSNGIEGSLREGSSPFLDQHMLISPGFDGIYVMDCQSFYLYSHGFDIPTIAEILYDNFKERSGQKCDQIQKEIDDFKYYAGIETQEEFSEIYKEKIMPLLLRKKEDIFDKIEAAKII